MPIIGFFMVCIGIAICLITWGALMTKGWTGQWYERKQLRNPRRR